ncbi:hypothetical protein HU200_040998 [Digitaria exilis]|uniref:Uncharacterized protein n=1 Tax=Digitaria exilis TaxID=1010633 RepID=A0A835BDD0_9POAL|nr:hypothetical protein HU200_040998 [Digitaria exilis]
MTNTASAPPSAGVARALADGDGSGAGATDLRLLLALLAARDGRFDEAIRRYGEAARGDPSDHRPKALGHVLCLMTGRPVGDLRWEDADDIPRALAGDAAKVAQLFALVDELVVAAALGGAPFAIRPEEEGGFLPQSNLGVVRSAADRAGVGLAVALRDDEMPVAKRLQLAALRAFLHVSVESLFKTSTVFVAKFTKPKEGEDQESDKEAAA